MLRAVADRYDIPVVLHLDHARDLDLVRAAIDHAFTSVMYDASVLPFEQNVRLTRQVVEMAHPRGVTVEGEIGHVGSVDPVAVEGAIVSTLTDPEEAAAYVAETGVDALAVSIGNAHGHYPQLPRLDLERLAQIRARTTVPLVLHGGSGTPDDQVRNAVRHGICKLNIYADCRIALGRGLRQAAGSQRREDPLPHEVFGPLREAVAGVVAEKIALLGSADRVEEPLP
jgi:fructose-bisphosphate aldolase class II